MMDENKNVIVQREFLTPILKTMHYSVTLPILLPNVSSLNMH